MDAQREYIVTPEEYLVRERKAEFRSEYLSGQVYAMAGATEQHVLITANVSREIGNQLKGKPCRTYAVDLRVKVGSADLYAYPDVVVVCGPPSFEDRHRDTLLNPTLIVEVLSESTERYDRGLKFANYRRAASLEEYVLVAQDRPHVEVFRRLGANGEWVLSEAQGLDGLIELRSIGCRLSLADVYDRVEFPQEPGAPK